MKNDITAISIANYLIEKYEVNNLYLQKLLYYLQNNYMYKNDGSLLFEEKIQKWKLGPVIPDVYHAFKENGTSNIIEPYQQYDIKIDNGSLTIEEKNDELPEGIKKFINSTMVD
ncbi:type II toxin-antitoxin system antitoxin SocA domain-containing protein, partial [Staphylococcus aureus]